MTKNFLKTLLALASVATLLTGCATNPGVATGASPVAASPAEIGQRHCADRLCRNANLTGHFLPFSKSADLVAAGPLGGVEGLVGRANEFFRRV